MYIGEPDLWAYERCKMQASYLSELEIEAWHVYGLS